MAEEIKNLEFVWQYNKPKTKVWNFVSSHSGDDLGTIEWYPKWRQYVSNFDGILMSSSCLRELADFLDKINKEHKEMKNNGK